MAADDGARSWYRTVLAGSVQTTVEPIVLFLATSQPARAASHRALHCVSRITTHTHTHTHLPPRHSYNWLVFYLVIFYIFLYILHVSKHVFPGLVRDRLPHQPGIPSGPDPPGSEGALHRRRRGVPLSPHGSNRADDQRGTIRQVTTHSTRARLDVTRVNEWRSGSPCCTKLMAGAYCLGTLAAAARLVRSAR